MEGGIHTFVLSPRRYGKTSLILAAQREFVARGGRAAYADLILCTNEGEVATTVLSAVVHGILRGPRKTGRSLEGILKRLRFTPTVSMGPDGSVTLGLDQAAAGRAWRQILDDAVDLLAEEAAHGPVTLALDEFQQVAEIGPKGIGGTFKAVADRLNHTAVVFSGSHLSVMQKLTKDRGAPLHGMGEILNLDVVPLREMEAYLRRRVRSGGKTMTAADARSLYELAGTIPNDVQWLAYAAFEAAGGDVVGLAEIEAGMAAIVSRQASGFAERFESLAPSQQRILKRLAASPTRHIFARDFLEAVDLANANAVTKAIAVLDRAELIRVRAGVHEVASPFLRHWLLASRTR